MQKSLFRVVENRKFLKRLRNVHLEKSVATGICRVQRSPKTAKTPAKVHLRLRFQNSGKPRTAGLCGRAARISDCGPLSCTKIERPSPLEKLSCKVRLFANRRSRKYRQKVTVTTLFPTVPHRVFNFSHKRPTFAFTGESGYTLGFQRKIAHSGLHVETGGLSLSRPQHGLELLVKSPPKGKPEKSGCTPVACVRFLRRRGPAGLRDPAAIVHAPTPRTA